MMKQKYILSESHIPGTFPVDWTKIPEDVIEEIPGRYLYNVLSVRGDGSLTEKTVLYLQPTSSFKRGSKKYDLGDIIIGV